jgi:hypothetical protein
MNRLSPRSPRALALCGLLFACVALAPISSFNTSTRAADTSCAGLKRWALAFDEASVTLADLANLNRVHRRAVFNAVSPAVRSQLVREHLGQVAQRSDLSPLQLALVKEGIALATPSFYTRRAPATMAKFEQFWRRAEAAFPLPLRRVWFDLGPTPAATSQPTVSLLNRLSGVARLHAQDAPPCECHYNYAGLECGGGWCPSGGCWQYWGCGPSGAYMCTGVCAP